MWMENDKGYFYDLNQFPPTFDIITYLGYVIGKEKLVEKQMNVPFRFKLVIVYPEKSYNRNDMKFRDAREEVNERIDTILRPSAGLFPDIEEALILSTTDAQILYSQLKGSMIADCYTANPTKRNT